MRTWQGQLMPTLTLWRRALLGPMQQLREATVHHLQVTEQRKAVLRQLVEGSQQYLFTARRTRPNAPCPRSRMLTYSSSPARSNWRGAGAPAGIILAGTNPKMPLLGTNSWQLGAAESAQPKDSNARGMGVSWGSQPEPQHRSAPCAKHPR